MVVWKKFVKHLRPVSKGSHKFNRFTKTVKNVKHLDAMVKKNKALKSIIHTVFNKNTVKLTVGATAVGVGISYINEYIQSNSGCFLKSYDSLCKVQALSCCQPDAVDSVPFCTLKPLAHDPCVGFDEDKEKSCCKLCDCQYNDCLPHQSMECRRPTIGDALGYYARELTSSFWNMLEHIFPWMLWILGVCGAFLMAWIGIVIYKKIRTP